VELGSTCERAIQRELALNSRPASPIDHMTQNGLLGFNDSTTPGEPKLIIYDCDRNGRVSGYSIRIAARDESSALRAYAAVKTDLEFRLGAPDMDSDRFNAVQRKLLPRMYTAATAEWTTWNKEVVHIAVDDRISPKGDWPVSIRVDGSTGTDKSVADGRGTGTDAQTTATKAPTPSRCEERAVFVDMVFSADAESQRARIGWRVHPGEDAESFRRLGFSPGDIVASIDGAEISEHDDFYVLLHQAASGKSVELSVLTHGTSRTLTLGPTVAAAALKGCD
jgi:hypothetical protein